MQSSSIWAACTATLLGACSGAVQSSGQTPSGPDGGPDGVASSPGAAATSDDAGVPLGSGVLRCVPGQAARCACVNGQGGAQTCLADGTYGGCVCQGAGGPVSPVDAGHMDAGSWAPFVNLAGNDGATCSAAEVCALQEQPIPAVSSQQGTMALVDRLLGQWVLCGATSVFGTNEAGLEFAADGSWYKLYASGGALVRGQGFDGQGTWSIVDTSAVNGTANPYQLNLNVGGGTGFIPLFPAFATNPRKMRLDNSGITNADYVFAACP